jgi:hypothetical protein
MPEPNGKTVEQIRAWIAKAQERERVRTERLVQRRLAAQLKTLVESAKAMGGMEAVGREVDRLGEEYVRLGGEDWRQPNG